MKTIKNDKYLTQSLRYIADVPVMGLQHVRSYVDKNTIYRPNAVLSIELYQSISGSNVDRPPYDQ